MHPVLSLRCIKDTSVSAINYRSTLQHPSIPEIYCCLVFWNTTGSGQNAHLLDTSPNFSLTDWLFTVETSCVFKLPKFGFLSIYPISHFISSSFYFPMFPTTIPPFPWLWISWDFTSIVMFCAATFKEYHATQALILSSQSHQACGLQQLEKKSSETWCSSDLTTPHNTQ